MASTTSPRVRLDIQCRRSNSLREDRPPTTGGRSQTPGQRLSAKKTVRKNQRVVLEAQGLSAELSIL